MIRKTLGLLLLSLVAVNVYAVGQVKLADGIVSSVNPALHLYTIAGGLITVDASAAKILDTSNAVVDFSAIKPGQHVSAIIDDAPSAAGVPLHATSVSILQTPVGFVSGSVDAIDLTAKTLTVLGLTIHTNDATKFNGDIPSRDPHSLADLHVGDPVTVSFDGNMSQLNAVSVHLITLTPPTTTVLFRVTVIAKNASVWIVSANQFGTEVHITSNTTIVGNPQVGQTVEILARIDDGIITAISIQEASAPPIPPAVPDFNTSGILKQRTADTIVVDNALALVTIKVTADTKFFGDPKVGDNVDVLTRRVGNDLYAITVNKRTTSITMLVIGPVIAINGQDWMIGAFHFVVNDTTVIVGSPKVGDRVRALGERQSNGTFIAKSIEKF